MGKRAARSQLRIRRETIRHLSGREMTNVAGGGWVASRDLTTVDTSDCNPNTCPKTNAWTGGDGDVIDALCHA
jgi:hypothetical protein